MIRCAVIPVAGLGKRMLPFTKCIPKEMFPFFSDSDAGLVMKPFLQLILEQMVAFGIYDVCLIVSKTKTLIQDYFNPDNFVNDCSPGYEYPSELDNTEVMNLKSLLSKIKISYGYQDGPRGFGDAVLCSMNYVSEFPFLVQAGDELVLSPTPLLKLENTLSKYSAEAGFLLRQASNPSEYGVVEGSSIDENTILVDQIAEKPMHPKSNTVVIAFYLFKKSIFRALECCSNGPILELTSAINYLIDEGHKVVGVKMNDPNIRAETGSVEAYYQSLRRLL